ncbi:MAG: hypothetical protein QOJ09_2089, partial [Actinomycetota bacterium]|nr:hypothetical protein [Actinomycetota bacterium]
MDPDLEPIDPPLDEVVDEQPPSETARKRRRWPLIGLVIAAVAVGGGAVIVLVTRDTKQTPEQVLVGARAFASARADASFSGRVRIEEKDPAGGASLVDRLELAGTAHLPDRAHYTVIGDGFASEVVAVGATLYSRDAAKEAELAAKKWTKSDASNADQRAGVIRDQGLTAGADEVGDPVGLLKALDAARTPTLVRRHGDQVVVKATVDPSKAYGAALAGQVDSADVVLTVLKDDRIDRAVLTARGKTGSVVVDYQFTNWGQRVQVAAPASSQLDPTPGIEEEDIAAFKDAKLFMPRGIPAGWVLESATVVPKDRTEENCEQVEIDYTDPNDPEAGYLSLYELPKTCSNLTGPRGSQPYKAGRYSGYAQEDASGVLAQIV